MPSYSSSSSTNRPLPSVSTSTSKSTTRTTTTATANIIQSAIQDGASLLDGMSRLKVTKVHKYSDGGIRIGGSSDVGSSSDDEQKKTTAIKAVKNVRVFVGYMGNNDDKKDDAPPEEEEVLGAIHTYDIPIDVLLLPNVPSPTTRSGQFTTTTTDDDVNKSPSSSLLLPLSLLSKSTPSDFYQEEEGFEFHRVVTDNNDDVEPSSKSDSHNMGPSSATSVIIPLDPSIPLLEQTKRTSTDDDDVIVDDEHAVHTNTARSITDDDDETMIASNPKPKVRKSSRSSNSINRRPFIPRTITKGKKQTAATRKTTAKSKSKPQQQQQQSTKEAITRPTSPLHAEVHIHSFYKHLPGMLPWINEQMKRGTSTAMKARVVLDTSLQRPIHDIPMELRLEEEEEEETEEEEHEQQQQQQLVVIGTDVLCYSFTNESHVGPAFFGFGPGKFGKAIKHYQLELLLQQPAQDDGISSIRNNGSSSSSSSPSHHHQLQLRMTMTALIAPRSHQFLNILGGRCPIYGTVWWTDHLLHRMMRWLLFSSRNKKDNDGDNNKDETMMTDALQEKEEVDGDEKMKGTKSNSSSNDDYGDHHHHHHPWWEAFRTQLELHMLMEHHVKIHQSMLMDHWIPQQRLKKRTKTTAIIIT